ncbi:MAG: hypothetical protein ACFCVD_20965 [Nodosilinea sp.]
MKRHLLFASLVGLSALVVTLPAAARPEIASGDQLLTTDVSGCLSLVDQFIAGLGVESEQGSIDRTGYFEDGSFRVLCYGAGDASLAVVFATHDQSIEIASNFIQMALSELSEEQALLQQAPSTAGTTPAGATATEAN